VLAGIRHVARRPREPCGTRHVPATSLGEYAMQNTADWAPVVHPMSHNHHHHVVLRAQCNCKSRVPRHATMTAPPSSVHTMQQGARHSACVCWEASSRGTGVQNGPSVHQSHRKRPTRKQWRCEVANWQSLLPNGGGKSTEVGCWPRPEPAHASTAAVRAAAPPVGTEPACGRSSPATQRSGRHRPTTPTTAWSRSGQPWRRRTRPTRSGVVRQSGPRPSPAKRTAAAGVAPCALLAGIGTRAPAHPPHAAGSAQAAVLGLLRCAEARNSTFVQHASKTRPAR
jgi:hypothetical protein